ncbi:hypothetical protein [Streptomyces poonensis]|uniref:hypothetical protein n=1 Tax=Streptomyces poonensis TaxID=68255 RepID=UPI0016737111|nr:hypothetical protein [Streptomyces poonensis]
MRRSLTLAAATAAMAPAVLFSAPGAYATGGASPEDTSGVTVAAQDDASTTTEEDSAPSAGDTNPLDDANDSTGPGESGSGSAGHEDGAADGEEGGSTGGEGAGGPSGENNTGGEVKDAEADPAKPGSDGPKGEAEPVMGRCNPGDPYEINRKLNAFTNQLPTVVAGAGFHYFGYNVWNKSDRDLTALRLSIDFDSEVWGTGEDESRYITAQYKDPATGQWADVSGGHITTVDVAAQESLYIDMRISVASEASPALGMVLTLGEYDDGYGGTCYSGEWDWYGYHPGVFDIRPAGWTPSTPPQTEPGTDPDTKPGTKPGTAPGTKPQGDKDEKPLTPTATATATNAPTATGHLAETGAGPALPTIALAGGLAVSAGVGAVYVVRRRKASLTSDR